MVPWFNFYFFIIREPEVLVMLAKNVFLFVIMEYERIG